MKRQFVKVMAVLFIGLAVVSCKKGENKVEAKEAQEEVTKEPVATSETYAVDAENSLLNWKGFKPTESHNGTIKLSEGSITLEGDKITGGNFIIDMKSIVNLDEKDPKMNEKLVEHLKNADFFDVEKHPFSIFTITGVEVKDGKNVITGNLTMKNIKKSIEFPASVAVSEGQVTLMSQPFTIDRTEWGIEYNSGKLTETLKDRVINDDIEISLNVKAKK